MPQLGQVHIDQPLTNVSIRYANDSYIGEVVAPAIPIDKRSGKIFVYGEQNLKVVEARRAPGSKAAEVDYSMGTPLSFNAEERALSDVVTDAEVRIADDPLKPEVDTTMFLTDRLKLILENDISADLTNTSLVTQNVALAGTTQWSDYTNSVPLTNIATAKKTIRPNIIRPANTFLVPWEVAVTLADHPSLKDLIKYTDPRALMESDLPPTVRGLRIVEAMTIQNTANEGQTVSLSAMWGKNALILYVNPRPAVRDVATFVLLDAPDDTTGARGFSVRRWRDDARKGDMVEVSRTYDLQFFQANGAYLYTSAIA